ncbi:hypothetical protein JYG23_08185 [Sedimentibacter sp. zth1]|uniref:hypothetical protein n=1 Tax=Sedimentibacter sp. zth1 TaxID=2816908 RepID=UPI001A92AEEA|nr:hypothetical protein [Sedimentibacter sp. zth1]QSX04686.1 hypothetical protein JYG23_08185 [Sedimentibacter sp. zth1]
MGKVDSKWNKISKRTMKWHMFVGFPLKQIIPIQLFLLVVLEFINKYINENIKLFIVQSIIKLIVAYLLGIVIGRLEWSYLEKLNERKFCDIKNIRKSFISIYGILFWGLNTMIAIISPFFESTIAIITQIIIWPLAGLVWGIIMWCIYGSGFEKYIN